MSAGSRAARVKTTLSGIPACLNCVTQITFIMQNLSIVYKIRSTGVHYNHVDIHHHHHLSVMELGHLLTPSGLTCPEGSSKVCH